MWRVGTDRVHAGLHHGWFRDDAGDEALQQVDVGRVRLVVSVIRVRFRAHVVTHLHKTINVLSAAAHFHNLNTNNPFVTLVLFAVDPSRQSTCVNRNFRRTSKI